MSAAPNKPEGLDMTVTEKDVIETCEVHGFPLDPDQLEVVAAVVNQMQLSAAPFQARVQPWMLECFGAEIAADKIERNHRFFEEATEAVQANGMTRSEAHQLVDYTFDRPVGELHQEIGGVMVTLAALCLASGQDMHAAGETELARIWTKVEAIRAKQAAKPKHSPLPAAPAQSPSLIGWWDSAEASGFRWKEGIVRSDFSNGTPIYATEPFLSFIPDAKRDELIGALLADLEKSDQRETDFYIVRAFIGELSSLEVAVMNFPATDNSALQSIIDAGRNAEPKHVGGIGKNTVYLTPEMYAALARAASPRPVAQTERALTGDELKLIACAADCISEAVRWEQDGFDTPPMPATEWDYNADQLAYALRALLTAAQPASGADHD